MELNWHQRQHLYENLSDVLFQTFEKGSRMKDIFGPTTQTLIREAVHTHCFYREMKPKITKKKVPNGEVNGKKTFKEVNDKYIFTLPIKMLVESDSFDIVREIDAAKLDGMA